MLHVLCDITIAADHARFGQAGPRVGSFDAGFGTAYLARILGEKRAREVWYLCRLYDAATMERWGLVNQVVPGSELRAEVRRWADEMLEKSPTALRVLKHSFNADTESPRPDRPGRPRRAWCSLCAMAINWPRSLQPNCNSKARMQRSICLPEASSGSMRQGLTAACIA